MGHDHGYGDPEHSFGYEDVVVAVVVAKFFVLDLSHLLPRLLTAREVWCLKIGQSQIDRIKSRRGSNVKVLSN